MALIASSKFLDFKSAPSPSGHDWYYIKRTNDKPNLDSAVSITTLVKIDGFYHYLFLKTKRPPLYAENKAEFCIESPAGLIADVDSNETLLECAKKELLEETGLIADVMYVELLNSCTSAGLSSETLSYVTAIVNTNTLKAQPVTDGGVITERFFIKADEIFDYINNLDSKKYSIAGALMAGVFLSQKRLNH